MDWPKVKTYLIVAFALLNALLFWQVYLLPAPYSAPQYLAEPTLLQIEADLAAINVKLKGQLPPTPDALPLLAVQPRPGNTGELPASPAGTSQCPVGNRPLTKDGDLIDDLKEVGLRFLQQQGGLPPDTQEPFLDVDYDGGVARLVAAQKFPGDIPVFNGYIEVCITPSGVQSYNSYLWDPGQGLDQGTSLMPAGVLLAREARPGGPLAQAAANLSDPGVTVSLGYRIVAYPMEATRLNLPPDTPAPDFVALPVWRLELDSQTWFDFDVIAGQRVH